MNAEEIVRFTRKESLTEQEMLAVDVAMLALSPDEFLATACYLAAGEGNTDTARILIFRWGRIPHRVGMRLMALSGKRGRGGMFSSNIPPYIPDTMEDAERIWENNPPSEEKDR